MQNHTSKSLKIRVSSVASNAKGVLADVDLITPLMHKFKALAFWYHATTAPHTAIDMNSVSTCGADVSKDAINLTEGLLSHF